MGTWPQCQSTEKNLKNTIRDVKIKVGQGGMPCLSQ